MLKKFTIVNIHIAAANTMYIDERRLGIGFTTRYTAYAPIREESAGGECARRTFQGI